MVLISSCEYCGEFKCRRIDCPNHENYLQGQILELQGHLPFLERELKMWKEGKCFTGEPLPPMLEQGSHGKVNVPCDRCGVEFPFSYVSGQKYGEPKLCPNCKAAYDKFMEAGKK